MAKSIDIVSGLTIEEVQNLAKVTDRKSVV